MKTENEAHSGVKILVDYWCFSVLRSEIFEDAESSSETFVYERIAKKFLLDGLEFQSRKGMYGYSSAFWYNGIVIAFGSMDTIYIQMSGSGCRTFETLHPGLTWESWLRFLQDTYPSLHFSRLDIACDTFGLLPLNKMMRAAEAGSVITKWRKGRTVHGILAEDISEIYFGSVKSDFMLRIYDKTAERRAVVDDPTEVPDHWVRCEYQLRNEAASSFIRSWQQYGVSSAYFGIMRNQLIFVKRYDGKNRDRAEIYPWWEQFLGSANQIKMAYEGGVEYNLQKLKHYVYQQAGSSIRTLLEISGGDMSELLSTVSAAKHNDRQKELLAVEGPNSEAAARRRQKLDDLWNSIVTQAV